MKKNIAQQISESIINTLGDNTSDRFTWNPDDLQTQVGTQLPDGEGSYSSAADESMSEELLNPEENYPKPNPLAPYRPVNDLSHSDHAHKVLSGNPDDYYSNRHKHSPETRVAIEKYTGSGYRHINSYLRHGNVSHYATEGELHNTINHLKQATKTPTEHEFYAYRGVKGGHIDTTPGHVFKDKAFTSTTLRPSIAQGFSVPDYHTDPKQNFRIHIKPGTKGHYDGSLEREFILHPGTSFRVGEKHIHPNGHEYTDLIIHHQED